MLTWLLVFGVGGCWSGYTDAAIIQAPDLDSAQSLGGQIAWAETAVDRRRRQGLLALPLPVQTGCEAACRTGG